MKLTRQKTSDMGTTDIFGQAVRSGHWGQKHYFIIENAGAAELEAIEDMLVEAGWESDGCPCYEDGFTSGFHIDIDEVDAFKEAYKEAKKGLKAYIATKAEPVVTPLRVIGDDVEYSVTLGGKEYTRYGNQYFVRISNSHNGPAPFWRTHNGRHIQAAIDEAIKAFEAAHAEALEINAEVDRRRALNAERTRRDCFHELTEEQQARYYAQDYDEAYAYDRIRNQAIRDEEVQLTTQIEFNKRQYIWEEVYSEEYKAIRLEVAHEAALAMDATFEENLVFLATPDMADIWYKHTDTLKARILAAAHAEALALDAEYGNPARFEYVNANGHKQMQLLAAAHEAALVMAANYASADQMANEFLTEQAHTEEALGK